jgi:hypothetical protein
MKFSEREGFKKVSEVLQVDSMNSELRNSLWNVLDIELWSSQSFMYTQYASPQIDRFGKWLWLYYFKQPLDMLPNRQGEIRQIIRDYFFKCNWYEVYDFIEFTFDYLNATEQWNVEEVAEQARNHINMILERELAGFRIIENIVTKITDEQEISTITEALEDTPFSGVSSHLKTALELLSNREKPDYRNSIKESISAVESMAKSITQKPKADLEEALKVLERSGKIHKALKASFSKLYGYTSDEGGIRHAMLEEPDLSASDSKFFLVSCSAFINYLKSKI